MQSALQSLIQQVDSSSSASATSSTATAGSSSGNSSTTATTTAAQPAGSSVATLQQDFQNLLASVGGTSSQATLGGFLQSLSQNLQGVGMTGNVVNAQA